MAGGGGRVGLLASDEMNLGLEGYLRERQATAVARLNQPPAALPGTAPGQPEPLGLRLLAWGDRRRVAR